MLLKRLRDTMARGVSSEETLGEVVRMVANEMVAEVCSVYLLRAGEVLELFATQGLNPDAVHRTRLRVGEGLVGDIAAHARPLALDDAQHHPQFAYRPETGEEIFQSLAGVPIVRAGRTLGVLVVQNRTRRQYDEEEVETLQTIAMVLAEMVAAGHFVSPNEVQQVDGLGLLPLRIDGVQLTPGVAIGRAVLHEPRISIQRVVAEDIGQEQKRFEEAAHGVRADLDRMLEAHDMQSGEQREILETFRMFVDDRGWMERVREAVASGLTAEAGVQRSRHAVHAALERDHHVHPLCHHQGDADDHLGEARRDHLRHRALERGYDRQRQAVDGNSKPAAQTYVRRHAEQPRADVRHHSGLRRPHYGQRSSQPSSRPPQGIWRRN